MRQEPQKKEQPNTYFVQDRFNKEMIRLQHQGQMVTASMGGALPEQTHPISMQKVLDVGCGTGDWLIETAKTYPEISLLVGVDVSGRMVRYAREQAEKQQVADRVEFHVMDALRMLEFPREDFDLVNQRLGMSYLRTWDWPNLLGEYQRIARPDGVIRITECSVPESNSPALNNLNALFLQTLSRAGHLFIPDDRMGVISKLVSLLDQHGLKNVQMRSHELAHRAGTTEGESFCENEKAIFRILLPFFQKWCRVPDNYEEIYQQALKEMEQPDFVGKLTLLTVWGVNISKK